MVRLGLVRQSDVLRKDPRLAYAAIPGPWDSKYSGP